MKARIASSFTLAGAIFGLFLLSPLAMALAHLVHEAPLTAQMPLRALYSFEMLKWTVPFTLLSSAAGLSFGLIFAGLRQRNLLVEQERQYAETLFNSVGEGLLCVDRECRILKANSALLEQAGFSREEEVKGKLCWQVLHRETGPCENVDYCPVREVFASGSSGTGVHRHYHRDGRVKECEVAAYPVRGSDGSVVQVITVTRDLTERRRAAEKMKAYTRQIEHTNYLKGLFTDILSHDLLNPAMVTVQMADHLAAKEHPRDAEEIAVIRRSARKLLTLLTDASKFAKMESLESLRKAESDIVPKLRDVIERTRPSFDERGMKLKLEGAASAKAYVNPLFEEVVQNLLSNALKYSPEKSTVTVTVAPVEGGVAVSVADEGEGVPDAFKLSIFERFERGAHSGVKGSGLGLAIARRIVDLLDGTIWVEDGPTGGSVFHVFIPARELS